MKRGTRVLLLISLSLCAPAVAYALLTSETIISAEDGQADDGFGASVAMSGDTLVVGAPGASDGGAAYVFTRCGGSWTLQQKLLPAPPNPTTAQVDDFGATVAISGETIAVGDPHGSYMGTQNGGVYVFVRNGGTWSQQAFLERFDDEQTLGWSLSLDGDTLAVGAPFGEHPGGTSGRVFVYLRSGTSWGFQQEIAGVLGIQGPVQFGRSVSLDQDTLVVGDPFQSEVGVGMSGTVSVFTRSGGTWTEQQELSASDPGPDLDGLGNSISLDGNTFVAGALFHTHGGTAGGAVYVFVQNGGLWTQQQELLPSDAAPGQIFGRSVAIEGDTVVVGAPELLELDPPFPPGGGAGSVYVFVRNGSTWSQQQKLTPSDAAAGLAFGFSVDLDAQRVISGAPEPGGEGAAYEYVENAGPILVCPEPVVLTCSKSEGLETTLTAHVSDATGDPLTVTWSVDSQNVEVDSVPAGGPPTSADVSLTHKFLPGTHSVQVTVSDGSDSCSCETTVTVLLDTTPPTITSVSASPNVLWPPNHKMVPVSITAVATDDCDVPICQVSGVSSNEPIDGLGDGDTSPDWEITGDLTVNLRSERSGLGSGRIYTIGVECSDSSNNVSTTTVNVTVPHNQ
jgi:FG-GAP repeat/PKD domain